MSPKTVVKASFKNAKVSPRKAGEVVALVRNRQVEDALTILTHTPRRAALAVTKVIKSCQENAVRQHKLKPESLVIQEIFVNKGQSAKRFRLFGSLKRPQRRFYTKKWSNIHVSLEGQARPPAKPKATKSKQDKR